MKLAAATRAAHVAALAALRFRELNGPESAAHHAALLLAKSADDGADGGVTADEAVDILKAKGYAAFAIKEVRDGKATTT